MATGKSCACDSCKLSSCSKDLRATIEFLPHTYSVLIPYQSNPALRLLNVKGWSGQEMCRVCIPAHNTLIFNKALCCVYETDLPFQGLLAFQLTLAKCPRWMQFSIFSCRRCRCRCRRCCRCCRRCLLRWLSIVFRQSLKLDSSWFFPALDFDEKRAQGPEKTISPS